MGGAIVPDDASGPRIGEGYRWAVYALDTDGLLVSSSELRTISP